MMAIEIKEYVGKGNIKHVVDSKTTEKKAAKKTAAKKSATKKVSK